MRMVRLFQPFMINIFRIITIISIGFSLPAFSQTDALPGGLPGIDGIAPILQLPSLDGTTASDTLFSDERVNTRIRENSVETTPSITGGVPGIDGLNFSQIALQHAFRGLDKSLLHAMFAESDPRLLRQITQNWAYDLPGLAEPEENTGQTLPGLDGLPVDLPR